MPACSNACAASCAAAAHDDRPVAIPPTSPAAAIPLSCTPLFLHTRIGRHIILANELPLAAGQRVLIVDDNEDAADTLASLLLIFEHTAHVAYSGIEALAVGDMLRPQLVILDIAMPRMDGWETARLIRERPWGRLACIVALTAWDDDDSRRRTNKASMDFHLTKPLAVESLLGILAGLPA